MDKRKNSARNIGILILVLFLSTLFLIPGCGKKEKAESPSEKEEAQEKVISKGEPVEEKEPIKVGAILAVTGPIAFLGEPEEKTLKMLVEEVNAQGGINGHKIELIIKDCQASPEKAITFANQLIEEEKVFAILGPTSSGTSLAIKEICEENGMLLLSCAAAEKIVDPLAQWVFTTPQQDRYAVQWVLKTMQEKGYSQIGIVYGATGFGKAGYQQFEKYAADYDIKIVIAEEYSVGDQDFTGLLTKVKSADVEAVVNWSVFPAQSIIPQNMKQIGFDAPLFHSHGFGNIKYVETIGEEAAEGILFPCGKLLAAEQLPEDDPQKDLLVEYKTNYEEKYNEQASTFGGHAYDAFALLKDALETVGPDRDKVREHIEGLDNFPGTGGIYDYSEENHNGLGMDSLVMYEVKDGSFTLMK